MNHPKYKLILGSLINLITKAKGLFDFNLLTEVEIEKNKNKTLERIKVLENEVKKSNKSFNDKNHRLDLEYKNKLNSLINTLENNLANHKLAVHPEPESSFLNSIPTIFVKDESLFEGGIQTNVVGQQSSNGINNYGEQFRTQAGQINNISALAISYLLESNQYLPPQYCAFLSQHWLMRIVVEAKAKYAMASNWKVEINDREIENDVLTKLISYDVKYNLRYHLKKYLINLSIYGISHLLFKNKNDNYLEPNLFYDDFAGLKNIEYPFIFPYLTNAITNNPLSNWFYKPKYWRIFNNRIVHSKNMITHTINDVPDIQKPYYLYSGISDIQKVLNNVFFAAKSDNELALILRTMRLINLEIPASGGGSILEDSSFINRIKDINTLMDNYGVLPTLGDESLSIKQTGLNGVTTLAKSAYQNVGKVIGIPYPYLFSESPENASSESGKIETQTLSVTVETVRAEHLTPVLQRFYASVWNTYIDKKQPIKPDDVSIMYEEMERPSQFEDAQAGSVKAQTYTALKDSGILHPVELANIIYNDRKSKINKPTDKIKKEMAEYDKKQLALMKTGMSMKKKSDGYNKDSNKSKLRLNGKMSKGKRNVSRGKNDKAPNQTDIKNRK